MEFTYSLTQEQMKTGLRYYLLWRFFGLRVAYSLLAVLLAAGSCAYGICLLIRPFCSWRFLLLTVVLLWLMPLRCRGMFPCRKRKRCGFCPEGLNSTERPG